MTTTTRACARELTCGQCEYFDGEYGDCLNSLSDRFQTDANRQACIAFYPDMSEEQAC